MDPQAIIDQDTLTPAERTLASNLDVNAITSALAAEDPSKALNEMFKEQAAIYHDGSHEPAPERKEKTQERAVVGARVRLVGLVNKADLNNRVGTIVPDRSGKKDGRIAVAVDGLEGPGIRLKPENVSINDSVVRVRDKHQRRVLRKQVAQMDQNAIAGGRMATIERVVAECQAHRGLPVREYGSSPDERERFWQDVHNLSGCRPDFSSAGVMVSGELNAKERAILREGGYDA